jgi:hypothetical protein
MGTQGARAANSQCGGSGQVLPECNKFDELSINLLAELHKGGRGEVELGGLQAIGRPFVLAV